MNASTKHSLPLNTKPCNQVSTHSSPGYQNINRTCPFPAKWSPPSHSIILSFSLLLNIVLSTTLLSLALIMLLLVLSLGSFVTSQAGSDATKGASSTVRDSRSQITELAASLLLLTFKVLLTASSLESL